MANYQMKKYETDTGIEYMHALGSATLCNQLVNNNNIILENITEEIALYCIHRLSPINTMNLI